MHSYKKKTFIYMFEKDERKMLAPHQIIPISRQDYYVNQKGVYYSTLVLFFSFLYLGFLYQVAIHIFFEEVKYGMARTN